MKIEYFHASKFGNGAMVAHGKVLVTGMKGPLEEGWQKKVEAFAAQISSGQNAISGRNHQ